MRESIETRELIELDGPDGVIRGTYHKPSDERLGSFLDRVDRDRIGVMFLNPWYPTRAWKGDSAVYWAESFAECCYPSFRLDMPGCGDSEGDLPSELADFINRGGYASLVAAQIKEITKRYKLSGVVIMGLCAGAVSAIFAASVSLECKGLVLMDPLFNLPEAPRSDQREKFATFASKHALSRMIRRGYHRALATRLRLFSNQLPRHSNFPLLKRWNELNSAGMPMLVLESRKVRGGEFDYVRYNLERSDYNSKVSAKLIEGAYHTFTDDRGRMAVRQHTEIWLKTYFPLSKKQEVPAGAVSAQARQKESCLRRELPSL
jgi:pimeloyl-ACP methyl ester carboxylesterase